MKRSKAAEAEHKFDPFVSGGPVSRTPREIVLFRGCGANQLDAREAASELSSGTSVPTICSTSVLDMPVRPDSFARRLEDSL